MSAYIVHPRTVSLILSAATDHEVLSALRSVYPHQTFAELASDSERDDARGMLGRYLLSVNVRSVQYRYRGESVETLPGYGYEYLSGMTYSPMPDYTFTREPITRTDHGISIGDDDARMIMGAIACYEYQSCELPEFDLTPAASFVSSVYRNVSRGLYADHWEYTGERVPLAV